MKYEYTFREVDLADNTKYLVIDLPKGMYPVEVFLFSEVHTFGDYFFEAVNSVLTGKENYREAAGNCCVLEIKKDKTKITFLYGINGEEVCEIETEELKELMLIWFEEEQKFKLKYGYK